MSIRGGRGRFVARLRRSAEVEFEHDFSNQSVAAGEGTSGAFLADERADEAVVFQLRDFAQGVVFVEAGLLHQLVLDHPDATTVGDESRQQRQHLEIFAIREAVVALRHSRFGGLRHHDTSLKV